MNPLGSKCKGMVEDFATMRPKAGVLRRLFEHEINSAKNRIHNRGAHSNPRL